MILDKFLNTISVGFSFSLTKNKKCNFKNFNHHADLFVTIGRISAKFGDVATVGLSGFLLHDSEDD